MMLTDKPQSKSGYRPEWVEMVRRVCLQIATVLGDLLDQQVVIVGGLVPGLIIAQENLPEGVEPHVGTMDLDLGLQIGILEGGQYKELSKRLRGAGFEPDKNDLGNPTFQRWKINSPDGLEAPVDFLIPPVGEEAEGGKLLNLEKDFAAIITPGLDLAFQDRIKVSLEGLTIQEEEAAREISVCGPGAFVVLKALAFRMRGEGKDAYDLYYVIQNYGQGIEEVVDHLIPLLTSLEAQTALKILQEEFESARSLGPMRASKFLEAGDDPSAVEDVVGSVQRLLSLCKSYLI